MTPENVIEQWANYFNNADLRRNYSAFIMIVQPFCLPFYQIL